MAGFDCENEMEWIEGIKSGGDVPLLEPDDCPNGWASPTGDRFMVRGPQYFTDKVKVPGGKFLLKPLGFDWIKGHSKISEVMKAASDASASGQSPFVWAFNLQVPSKDNYSAIAYFVSLDPVEEGSLMDQFLKGDDLFKNSRLKLIANIVKGPWIVRTAVGEQAICILGRAVACKYFTGENFIEVDVDIGASMVANAIVHLAFGYITTLTVDLAFLIESQTEAELPERILGTVRFSELNPASAGLYEPPSDESAETSQASLGSRWWKSIGQGFSHLLLAGSQDGDEQRKVDANGDAYENGERHNVDSLTKKEANGDAYENGDSQDGDAPRMNANGHVHENGDAVNMKW